LQVPIIALGAIDDHDALFAGDTLDDPTVVSHEVVEQSLEVILGTGIFTQGLHGA
jgi:hypothetical protein